VFRCFGSNAIFSGGVGLLTQLVGRLLIVTQQRLLSQKHEFSHHLSHDKKHRAFKCAGSIGSIGKLTPSYLIQAYNHCGLLCHSPHFPELLRSALNVYFPQGAKPNSPPWKQFPDELIARLIKPGIIVIFDSRLQCYN